MAKLKNKHITLICWALIFVLFNVITLVLADLQTAKASFWCGLVFIDIAFIVIGLSMLLVDFSNTKIVGMYMPFVVVSIVYGIAVFGLNLIYLLIPSSDEVTFCVIINCIIIVAYVILMLLSLTGFRSINQNEEHIQTKVREMATLGITVGALEYKATSNAVKAKIRELKEKIGFSDQMGNEATKDAEVDIKNQVQIISSLLNADANEQAVLSAIEDAIQKVNIRNQILMASK